MSLQRHQHRQEVWHVISGTGEDQGRMPSTHLESGHTYIVEPGQVHRIANTGEKPLVIVEVQVGACRETDIERLHDDYQRTT